MKIRRPLRTASINTLIFSIIFIILDIALDYTLLIVEVMRRLKLLNAKNEFFLTAQNG
jgi:hypothetical protein